MSSRRPPKHDLSMRGFDRILLVKPSSLGDVIHALPVLSGLRVRYPDARIDWLVSPAFAPLIAHHPDLSEAVIFDRRFYAGIGRNWAATKAFGGFVRGLRQRRYDLVIDLQGLFRSGFLTFVTRAPVRIGFRRAREFARFFYTHYLYEIDANVHAVDRNYLVASLLGFEDVPIRFDLALTEDERRAGKALVRRTRGDEHAPIVGVIPGTRWETKQWAVEKFSQAIDLISQEGKAHCILLGSPDERGLCADIVSGCNAPVTNLAGRTNVRELAAAIASCDTILCHDSAPMHFAVALNKPLVCLIGPTNPARTGPYRRPEDVCRLDLDCSPCYFRRLAQCPHNHRCMRDLSVSLVVERVGNLLPARCS